VPKASSVRGVVSIDTKFESHITGILTDVDVTQGGQALAELSDLGGVGLDLLALGILGGALLLDVETQVLQQDNLAVLGLVDDGLDLGADAVRGELDALAQLLLKLGEDGLQAVLGVDLAVRAAQVGHQDDGLGAIVDGVLDGGDGTDNTLGVGDVLVGVKRDVEVDLESRAGLAGRGTHIVYSTRRRDKNLLLRRLGLGTGTYTDEDTLALQVDVGDGELVGERHGGDGSGGSGEDETAVENGEWSGKKALGGSKLGEERTAVFIDGSGWLDGLMIKKHAVETCY
jgi:hypothetical protein